MQKMKQLSIVKKKRKKKRDNLYYLSLFSADRNEQGKNTRKKNEHEQ